MQANKEKMNKMLRKLTSPQPKANETFNQITNLKNYMIPKRSKKSVQKASSKLSESSKKILIHNKSYLFNKTTFGTPYEKSAMLSYLSTPNEKSFNIQKLKMFRTDHPTQSKQQFQSTEDQNYSQEHVKVNFFVNGKKVFHKIFTNYVKLDNLATQFVDQFNEVMDRTKTPYFGIIGFQTIPFNYHLSHTINSSKYTFQWLLNEGIKQINLTPLLLKKAISYDNLQFSDFQIIKFLGSGGFSQVYLAKCKIDNQYCALKFIKKESITTAKKVKMLENQKNILFQIKHDNLIDLVYAFETKNYIVFGLEYCPNGNLYNYLQRMKNLKEEQAKSIFMQILSGLQYLHNNNILFRDIKLQNILFDFQGKIKITDFGLSKPEIDQNQITYSYCGSPEYMAPEMLTKSGHSYQVDYYALGILLYELLFGRSPFYAPKKEDIFMAILHSEPKFPKSPIVSKQVKELIRGLLAKNPNHRIGSLKGIKEILVHPWLRNYEQESINQNTNYLNQNNSNNKDFQNIKDVFQEEQACKKFQKLFFKQNFVNRTIYQKVTQETTKFKKQKDTKLKNNFTKTSSSKRK